MRNIPPRGFSTGLGMTRVCLAKALYFACLFRHATSDVLLCWFIAECSSCVGADAKTRITITLTEANAARGSASVDRNHSKFAD